MSSNILKYQEVYVAGRREFWLNVAFKDVIAGGADFRLWIFLAWQDIKQRYRRSILGPFWITLSTGIMVTAMSILYGRLFKMPMDTYAPFLALGTIIWSLMASLINESCGSFMAVDSLIKQVRMPLTVHVFRMVWRNMLIFFHNIVILIPVWLIYDKTVTFLAVSEALLGLLLIAVNASWLGVVLGTCATRFRDIQPIVTSLVQVVFFVTPVMWAPEILEGRGATRWLIEMNPFFHFLELIRAPLLNGVFPVQSWGYSIGITAVGCLLGMFVLGRYRTRVPYWL